MRLILIVTLLLLPAVPALAQQSFSPISGPNDAIPSPVCDVINFGFCPQPAPPAPFPDPRADLLPPPPPAISMSHPMARRHHRHRLPLQG